MTKAMEEEEKVEPETLEGQENGENSQKTPELSVEELAELRKKAEAYEAQKIRAEKAEKEAKLAREQKVPVQETNSIDQIKLGKKLVDYSDEELDFVVEHAKSKKPEDVLEALKNPYVVAGIEAQRMKVEKEKTLKPSGGSPEVEAKKTVKEILATGTDAEKEKVLLELGMMKNPRPRADRQPVR